MGKIPQGFWQAIGYKTLASGWQAIVF